jgi:type III pantothenate kinase
MNLLFDIGNTRIKWAFDLNNELQSSGEVLHRGRVPAEVVSFVADMELPAAAQVEAVWAINVAGAAIEVALAAAIQARFGVELRVAKTTQRCGAVVNGYTAIEQLGADRWAALVGAWQHFREAVCVVDAGTAVTIDLVGKDGRHCGGIILPGLELMTSSLNRDTSDIEGFASNSVGLSESDIWYGHDTLSAVQRGALFAIRAAIAKAVEGFTLPDEARPLLVLTGGDAKRVLPLSDYAVQERPMLVLEGLRCLAGDTG